MDILEKLLASVSAVTYRAGALRFRIEPAQGGRIALIVDDAAATGRLRRTIEMRAVVPESEGPKNEVASDRDHLPLLMIFRGMRRHPQRAQASASWVNEAGDGLIAVLDPASNTLIHATIDGVIGSARIPIAPAPRGRPNLSMFWLAVTAMSLPINLTRRIAMEVTGLSGFTVDGWLHQSAARGWLKASPDLRNRRFTATIEGLKELGERVESRWPEWRQGRMADRGGPPRRTYFLARSSIERYHEIAEKGGEPCIPTGITVLEQRANLVQTTTIRELAFITTPEGLRAIAGGTNLQFSETRDIPGASEATVLSAGHPVFRLARQRRLAEREPWPLGLAALDAMDHPNARIAMLAKEQWLRWLTEIQTINIDTFAPER